MTPLDASSIGKWMSKRLPKLSHFFKSSDTLLVNTQFNETVIVRESFEYSIRAGQVSTQIVHLFYVIHTCQPDEIVLTISESRTCYTYLYFLLSCIFNNE